MTGPLVVREPISDRLRDGVVVRGDCQAVFVVTQDFLKPVLGGCFRFAAGLAHDSLAVGPVADGHFGDPALPFLAPVQPAVASTTTLCHSSTPDSLMRSWTYALMAATGI